MKRTILFCGNGMSSEIIEVLKNKYNILLISEFENDVGNVNVDYFIKANSKDPEEALAAAKQIKEKGYDFDAVLSLCWDSSISVARIANYYNLFGIPEKVAFNSSDKAIRSSIFAKCNIPAPNYKMINHEDELSNILLEFELPVVIKPLNLSSSKGVVKVDSEKDLLSAYQYSISFCSDKDKRVIINEYVEGTEYSLEGLMIKGKLHTTGISERVFDYSKYSPYFVEVGDIMPTYLTEKLVEKFKKRVESAANALEIINGVVKADLILDRNNEVKIFEITPRLGGPRFGTEMIPLHNGTDILEAAIQQALGKEIDIDLLVPKYNKGVVNRSIFPIPGIITEITGLEEIINLPGYYDFKWWNIDSMKIGDIINQPKYGCGGVGYIIASGDNRSEAIINADNIEKTIKIKTVKVGI